MRTGLVGDVPERPRIDYKEDRPYEARLKSRKRDDTKENGRRNGYFGLASDFPLVNMAVKRLLLRRRRSGLWKQATSNADDGFSEETEWDGTEWDGVDCYVEHARGTEIDKSHFR